MNWPLFIGSALLLVCAGAAWLCEQIARIHDELDLFSDELDENARR